jgi:group I intron endonuclease
MIIYKTTCLIDNRIYIGKDKNNKKTYLGSGKYFKNALKKYGKENFKKEILEECTTINHLNEREEYWIELYNSRDKNIGFNIAQGGEGGNTYTSLSEEEKIQRIEKFKKTMNEKYGGAWNKGKPMTDKQKEQLSLSKQGVKYPNRKSPIFSEEHKRKISETNKLRCSKMSDEERKQIGIAGSQARIGTNHSDEVKKIISEKLVGNDNAKGYTHTEEAKKRMSDLKKGTKSNKGYKWTKEQLEKKYGNR